MRVSELLKLNTTENWKNLAVTGLVETIEEAVTKKGDPYVRGVLLDRDSRISFRIFNTALSDVTEVGIGQVAKIVGDMEIIPGATDRSFKVASTPTGPAISLAEEEIGDYIYMQPYKPEALAGCVTKMIEVLPDSNYKTLALKLFEQRKDLLLARPYSTWAHIEKGGALYHIFLAMKAIDKWQLPAFRENGSGVNCSVNKALIYCALLLVNKCFDTEIDEVTGCIKDENEASIAKYRGYNSVLSEVFAFPFVKDEEGNSILSYDEIEELTSLLLLANQPSEKGVLLDLRGTSYTPTTPEAFMFLMVERCEPVLYRYFEVERSLTDDNLVADLGFGSAKVVRR